MERLPKDVVFHLRQADPSGHVDWRHVSSQDLFAGRTVILMAVPGAFTPTCSESHLPGFEENAQAFFDLGVDEIFCLSVNDAFVMNAWADALGIKNVTMLADGNGDFSRLMGMLVARTAQGLGLRSWRYSLYAEDMVIKALFEESNKGDNPPGVPMAESGAEKMLDYLKSN